MIGKLQVGDIVIIKPHIPLCGDAMALVTAILKGYVTVANGKFSLAYEPEDLEFYGRIVLGRSYGTSGGNRFRRYEIKTEGRNFAGDIKIREGKNGTIETRIIMQKKLAYEKHKSEQLASQATSPLISERKILCQL